MGDPRAPAQPLPTWAAPSIEDPSPRKRLRTSASGTSLGYPVDYLASQSQHANALEPASLVKLDNRLIRELVGCKFLFFVFSLSVVWLARADFVRCILTPAT